MEGIENCHEANFLRGKSNVGIRQLYDDFTELMHSSLNEQFYEPALDSRDDEPIEYTPEFIKCKTDWADCVVEIGKYIMYLDRKLVWFRLTEFENGEVWGRLTEFKREMREKGEDEKREEEEDDEHGKFVALDVGRTHMTGMLCRLKEDWSVRHTHTHT